MADKIERSTFWLVWRDRGNAPTFQHFQKSAALAEAERLARLTPGEVFFVMKSTAAVCAPLPEIQHIKLVFDPIPF
ncbi:hypothetical protein [Mesorhizobium sp. Root172]|uniref:hypothetical protein n=1 Tax=Mesorhizobium sp. Root172 TaxID=1736481 RepID=UPI0006F44E3A|nr:hypothetical protein [Mesorhizobium sp. Root172]KRB26290.1 hypothetical protein ASE05_10300 [Mesorhizobium sp. Root172]